MKYLKKFENHQAYQAAESGLILPNVSLCVQENEVHYNPYVDPYGGHEYVEIGGKKWATMNIGANSITDYGLYFQWGDTQGYTASQVDVDKDFTWNDYKYGTEYNLTKYNNTDGKTILEASDDAATVAWGGNWRMPTNEEYQTFGNSVNVTFVTNYEGSGVNGLLCTDKTDNTKSLFFPAAGYCAEWEYNGIGGVGNMWCNSINGNTKSDAHRIYFGSGGFIYNMSMPRYYGYSVRPVAN